MDFLQVPAKLLQRRAAPDFAPSACPCRRALLRPTVVTSRGSWTCKRRWKPGSVSTWGRPARTCSPARLIWPARCTNAEILKLRKAYIARCGRSNPATLESITWTLLLPRKISPTLCWVRAIRRAQKSCIGRYGREERSSRGLSTRRLYQVNFDWSSVVRKSNRRMSIIDLVKTNCSVVAIFSQPHFQDACVLSGEQHNLRQGVVRCWALCQAYR
mmetsp:Transcript_88586/g.153302  ORF Transcript_88586/g.153302 Transcript_88586/m.153302 type:complete len:215 (+) Transcript_88586:1115-1759(+)